MCSTYSSHPAINLTIDSLTTITIQCPYEYNWDSVHNIDHLRLYFWAWHSINKQTLACKWQNTDLLQVFKGSQVSFTIYELMHKRMLQSWKYFIIRCNHKKVEKCIWKKMNVREKIVKEYSVVLTGRTSTRNVYICAIFSCYSGYQCLSFRLMHFFSTEQTCGFQAHHYTSHLAFNPSVPTRGPLYNTPHCSWGR